MTAVSADRLGDHPMYEVWISTTGDMTLEARFKLRADAVRHVQTNDCTANQAIRCPDGTWLRWRDGKPVGSQDTA